MSLLILFCQYWVHLLSQKTSILFTLQKVDPVKCGIYKVELFEIRSQPHNKNIKRNRSFCYKIALSQLVYVEIFIKVLVEFFQTQDDSDQIIGFSKSVQYCLNPIQQTTIPIPSMTKYFLFDFSSVLQKILNFLHITSYVTIGEIWRLIN